MVSFMRTGYTALNGLIEEVKKYISGMPTDLVSTIADRASRFSRATRTAAGT